MSTQARLYLISVIALGLVPIALYAPRLQLEVGTITLISFFAVLSFIAELFEISLTHKRGTSTASTLHCAVLFISGPSAITWAILLGTLSAEIVLRSHYLPKNLLDFLYRVGFNTSQLLLSGWLAIEIFKFLGGHAPPYQSPVEYLPLALAFVGYTVANTALVSGIITLTQRTNFTYFLKFKLQNLFWHFLALGVLAILIAVLYAQSPWNTMLVLVPLVLVHVALRGYMKLRQEAQRTLETMVQMLHKRDTYTGEHSDKVALLAQKIAHEMQLPEDQVETIYTAALVHDIGKVAIPDNILNKPGKLNEEEWAVVKQHTIVGFDLLKNLEMYREAAKLVKYEHERWDGQGYPEGLKDEAIPLGARVIHVTDAYHALTSDRHYRRSQGKPVRYEPVEAIAIIQKERGKQFDPHVVDALIRVVAHELKEPLWSSFGRFS